ncbi:MAG: TetR/AcrR family transcriptional regulator [Halanaerobiales bacterium]|nr:TetR/AcrR family transcriptional regulator [Halanaerobiales bacterium]
MSNKDLIAEKFLDCLKKKEVSHLKLNELQKYFDFNLRDIFKNKDEIIKYLIEEKLDEKIKLIKKMESKDTNLQNKLIFFFDSHFNFLKQYPIISDLLIKNSMSNQKNKIEIIKRYMDTLKSTFRKLIEKEIQTKSLRNVDPDIIANAILYTTHGVTIRIKYDESYNYAQAKKELINFIYFGLNK